MSKNMSQSAFAIISVILEAVNHETESVFTVNSSASSARIANSRLLEARVTNGANSFAIWFSDELIFQIVDLMTGGASCHFTKIVEKPFTTFELSVINYIFTQALGVQSIQFADLGKRSDSAIDKRTKNDFCFTIAGPKSECAAYVTPQSMSDLSHDLPLRRGGLNSLVSSLDNLQLDVLAEALRYELPQTCAFALQMMNRDSAGALLKMLPWELQQDVGVRFITMKNVRTVVKELLIQACHINSRTYLKMAQ